MRGDIKDCQARETGKKVKEVGQFGKGRRPGNVTEKRVEVGVKRRGVEVGSGKRSDRRRRVGNERVSPVQLEFRFYVLHRGNQNVVGQVKVVTGRLTTRIVNGHTTKLQTERTI